MHLLLRPGYAIAGHIARALASAAPSGDRKLWRTLRGRRDILERYARWGAENRRIEQPLLWVHAPSVGEGLQARPVIQIARQQHPRTQVAYTHFSPSAERFAQTIDADFIDYLPFDTAADGEAALDALRPSALVFAKLDVWPMLVERAARRGVKLGVISATLPVRSRRRSALGRALLGAAYGRLDAVGAIAQDDADRLIELGVRPRAIRVTGDTRYDQVWQRARAVDRSSAILRPLIASRPTIVAGSTWPSDERVLLAAFARARAAVPSIRLVIAPHEPTEDHLAPIEAWAGAHRIAIARPASPAATTADIVVIDSVGILGDLYALADLAFVGGGFHGAGLHSVLEPAAFGVPIVFGPRTGGARDAELLVARGGAAVARTESALTDRLLGWVRSQDQRADAGARARAVVFDGLGAAQATYELVRTLVPD